jgi:hypothetical protein
VKNKYTTLAAALLQKLEARFFKLQHVHPLSMYKEPGMGLLKRNKCSRNSLNCDATELYSGAPYSNLARDIDCCARVFVGFLSQSGEWQVSVLN